MSKNVFKGPGECREAVESAAENPRVVKVEQVLGESALRAVRALALRDNDLEERQAASLEILCYEVPEFFDAIARYARELNAQLLSKMRVSEMLTSPVLMRNLPTPIHADSFEFNRSRKPFAYGLYVGSFGIYGSGSFHDYGLVRLVLPRDIDDTSFVGKVGGIYERMMDASDELPYDVVEQEEGDLVIIPGIPFPVLHRLAASSEDRVALVSGQLIVDSRDYRFDNPGDMADLRKEVRKHIRVIPPAV